MSTQDLLDLIGETGHVGEIARLLAGFERRRSIRLGLVELIELANQTAGATYRYPNPDLALELSLAIGLLQREGHRLSLTEVGVQFLKLSETKLELSFAQSKMVFGLLLDDPTVVLQINSLLQHFGRGVSGVVEVKDVPATWSASDQTTARVLQQLKVIEEVGHNLRLNKTFEHLLPTSSVNATGLTEEALWKRLEAQRVRAREAEELVVIEEKKRLIRLGRRDLAALVVRISAENVLAGYDISSFEDDESHRLIEVKSSVGEAIRFEWSMREHDVASKYGPAYWIYFVPFANVLQNRTVPIWILRDPIDLIRVGRLTQTPASFAVSTVSGISAPRPSSRASLRKPLREWP